MLREIALGVVGLALLAAVVPAARSGVGRTSAQVSGEAPDTVPELFAEGVVSTGDNEFSTAVTPDGKAVFWTVSAPNVFQFPFVILMSTHGTKGWSAPRVAPFSGSGFSDADPAMSPDGKRIFFMSRRPASGTAQRTDFDIWVYEHRTHATRRIDEVSTDASDIFPSVTSSGTLYFVSDRPGGFGAGDIYRSRLVAGTYSAPENIGPVVNTADGESNVFVAPDESYIIFSSARTDGRGGSDLYMSYRSADGNWIAPRSLDRINTEWDDYAPTVTPDGKWLYFTSRRPRAAPGVAPGAKLDYAAVRDRFRSAGNGNADIWRIPFTAVRR
jgi:Tol biopolymer transport system component